MGGALPPLLHLHGVAFTSWLALLRVPAGSTRAWLAFAEWLTSRVG